MPLARYFVFVGGVLLALLFLSDAYLPKLPAAQMADTDLPVIRIHTDRKWPERVVYDTSHATIIPAQIANPDVGPRPRQRSPHRGQGAGAGGICTDATIRFPAAAAIRAKEAGSKAARQTENCKETRGAADDPGGAATAIWLVWQPHLVSRLTGAPYAEVGWRCLLYRGGLNRSTQS